MRSGPWWNSGDSANERAAAGQYNPAIATKTGIMVGIGEHDEEVLELLRDA